MRWSRNAAEYRWNMRSFQKAMRETPEEIHWPTPNEPWTSWPREFDVLVRKRRRNFVITGPESKP